LKWLGGGDHSGSGGGDGWHVTERFMRRQG
jgi:hypothetical protein